MLQQMTSSETQKLFENYIHPHMFRYRNGDISNIPCKIFCLKPVTIITMCLKLAKDTEVLFFSYVGLNIL